MTADDLPEICRTSDVAKFFGVSNETIREWQRNDMFPNAFKPAKIIFIPKADVIALAHQKFGDRRE